MNDLCDKIDTLLEGHDIDEAIRALAFALADTVAFATEYAFDAENETAVTALVQSAYKFCCATKTDTVTVH